MNGQLAVSTRACDCCGHACWPGDQFCGGCGASLVNEPDVARRRELVANSRPAAAAGLQAGALLNHRGVVLGLLFCVGPMGLPLLWLSPRFSMTFKVATSIFYFALTVLVPLGLIVYFLGFSIEPIVTALERVGG